MKHTTLLTITSLFSLLLLSLHIVDDIVRGISPAGFDNMTASLIYVVWLCGTLLLSERRLGYIIMILGGIFAAAMPVLHLRGARIGAIAEGSGGFFFIWTILALGTTGIFTIILAVRGLWSQRSAAKT